MPLSIAQASSSPQVQQKAAGELYAAQSLFDAERCQERLAHLAVELVEGAQAHVEAAEDGLEARPCQRDTDITISAPICPQQQCQQLLFPHQ